MADFSKSDVPKDLKPIDWPILNSERRLTWWAAFASVGRRSYVRNRALPRGIFDAHHDAKTGDFIVQFNGAIRYWWAAFMAGFPIAVLTLFFPVMGIISTALTMLFVRTPAFGAGGGTGLLFIGLIAFAATVVIFWFLYQYFRRAFFPVIFIKMQDDVINVGKMTFLVQNFVGFRLGGDDGAKVANVGSSFADELKMFSSLRVQYGAWGEITPYAISTVDAANIVVFLNRAIAQKYGQNLPTADDLNSAREESFEASIPPSIASGTKFG